MNESAPQGEPGWKRAGRNGPFDWWLGCKDHGYNYEQSCMSCGMAQDHNIAFQAKLNGERAAPQAAVAPLFWYRPVGKDGGYEGPVHNNSVGGKMLRDEMPGQWFPLYAGLTLPAVVQAGSHLDHPAADDRTQPAAPQLDTQRATEGMPAPVEPKEKQS